MSVIIPVLNEERDVAACLASVGSQDYPQELLEVIVVDGCSDDGTVSEVKRSAAALGIRCLSVLENPRRRTSTSLNVGLRSATGDIVVRLDARSRVGSDYISSCTAILAAHPEVGVVGGAQVAEPRSSRALDVGIARALRNRYSTGLGRYRRARSSGPADTVWMGVFRREELLALGGWPDEVALNEDFELNRRYRQAGRVVWFDSGLRSSYVPRSSLIALARQYFYFGRVKGTWWARGTRPSSRHLVLLAVAAGAAAAWVAGVRRLGALRSSLLGVGVLVAVEEAGEDGPKGGVAGRVAASVAIATYTTSWAAGVVAGVAGELVGIHHRHG